VKTRQKIIAVQHRGIDTEQGQQDLALALDEVSGREMQPLCSLWQEPHNGMTPSAVTNRLQR
jgi:hypothetical protein